MQQGTISELGQSKSGKPKVKISGTWYSIGTTHGLQPGSTIEFEAHEFQYNGKQFWGIDKFGLVGQPPMASVAPPQNAPQRFVSPPQLPSTPAPISAPVGYTEPERLWLSNIIAAAINAGAVKSAVDLIPWTNAALYALRHAKADMPDGVDPEVGF